MIDAKASVRVALRKDSFSEKEREVLRFDRLCASTFRYDTGVEAIRLSNSRGHVVVLPYMGQMVWAAAFDGVELAMKSMFSQPRPAKTIVETYGCLAYHSGLLRNGVPSAEDTHPPHGEAPCADMDEAGLACGVSEGGPWIAVTGTRDYAVGFGAHYRATPRVVLGFEKTSCGIVMEVQNVSAAPMELMYMCHVNFVSRKARGSCNRFPSRPSMWWHEDPYLGMLCPRRYLALIDEFAANPARLSVLNESHLYDPEQVFYIKGLKRGPDELVHFMLLRRDGDAFAISWDPDSMPHCVRWIFDNKDQRVAAFAMPATCEPEGYSAEKRKGNVRLLASGASATFTTNVAFVSRDQTGAAAAAIEGRFA